MRYHVGRIHAGEGLVVGVFEYRGGAHRERTAHVAYEDSQGVGEVRRQGGGHELGENLGVAEVGVDHVLEAVLEDEAVEIFGGDHQRAGHEHPHILPLAVEVVFGENVVQEGETPGFSAQRTVAQAGEPDGVVVGGGVETGHDPEALAHAVVVQHPEVELAYLAEVGLVVDVDVAERVADAEQTAAVEPARDIVPACEIAQGLVGHGLDQTFELVEIAGAGCLLPGQRVGDYEVAERELAGDVFAELVDQGLGRLAHETHPELLRHRPHALLRGLQQVRQRGVVGLDEPAEIDAGVNHLGGAVVALVEDEAHVGDDAEHVGLVFLVELHRLVVADGRACA